MFVCILLSSKPSSTDLDYPLWDVSYLRWAYGVVVSMYRKSIYEGFRRPRWSQFASEIYKVDTIVYGTYNVGTWRFHLFVFYDLWCSG